MNIKGLFKDKIKDYLNEDDGEDVALYSKREVTVKRGRVQTINKLPPGHKKHGNEAVLQSEEERRKRKISAKKAQEAKEEQKESNQFFNKAKQKKRR